MGAEAVNNAPEKQNWIWHGDFLEGEDVIEAKMGLAGHSNTLPQLAKLSIHYKKKLNYNCHILTSLEHARLYFFSNSMSIFSNYKCKKILANKLRFNILQRVNYN
jgi:hypothetical protein